MRNPNNEQTKFEKHEYEVYRLFVNNLFNLISYTKASKEIDKFNLIKLYLTDTRGVKHSFYYSIELKSIIYKNLAGSIIFNPNMKDGIMLFLRNFDSESIRKELMLFEETLMESIDNL